MHEQEKEAYDHSRQLAGATSTLWNPQEAKPRTKNPAKRLQIESATLIQKMWEETEAARKRDAEEEVEKRVHQALKATFGSSSSSKSPSLSIANSCLLLLPRFAFLIKMAGRILSRKVSSQLPKLRPPAPQEQVVSTRAFASAAAKAQDDQATSVEVGRGSTDSRGQAERAVSRQGGQGGQRGAVANLGWPGSAIPSLFSPLFNSFMRPTSLTQMMDTLDHLSSSFDTATRSGAKSRIPWDVMEDDKCFKLRIDLPRRS
ncbi:hypothetical protein L7F22_039714 [Adiantum nelumboides]|nr:hypothetical protein [Adiantum nelumboides]